MRFPKLLNVLLLLLITACTPQPAAHVTPAPALLPSLEIPPTRTATSFVTPTATVTPMITSTPTVTATLQDRLVVDLLSPDGTVKLQSYDYHKYEIIDSYGMVIWTFIKDKGLLNAGTTSFWIPMGIRPLHWSPDGKKLFLAASQSEDNSSTKYYGNAFADADEIFRFDLETGEMIALVPGQIHGYYAAVVSPDARQMVYANQTETPVSIKLLDLETMEAKTLYVAEEKILEVGSFGWSPDMTQMLFSTLEFEPKAENGNKRIYNIYLMELESLNIQRITGYSDMHLNFEEWDDQGMITYLEGYKEPWHLNLNTKELSKIEQPAP